MSWETLELIWNMISLRATADITFGDFLKEPFKLPTARSASELDSGWYAEECLCLMFSFLNFSLKSFLKAGPSSDMTHMGFPNSRPQFLTTDMAASVPLFLVCSAIIYPVSLSTRTM